MTEPDQRPTYDELVKYCEDLHLAADQRARDFERFMSSIRRFRTQEQLILLLIGACSGISIYKLWLGI